MLDFAQQVESPRKVGLALGSFESQKINALLLPAYLGYADKAINAFIGSFVWGRYWSQKLAWIDARLGEGWNSQKILAFLILLPFERDIWHRAEQLLGNDVEEYWKEVPANPWGLEQQYLLEAAEKLVSYGRPRAAIDCLFMLADTVRKLAESYEHDANRQSERDIFDE